MSSLDPQEIIQRARAIAKGAVEVDPSSAIDDLHLAIALQGDTDEDLLAKALARATADAPSLGWDPNPVAGPLRWTIQSTLDAPDLVTLDSPRVCAWFLGSPSGQPGDSAVEIEEVIILGRGTPRVRAILGDLAFHSALSLPRTSSALLLDGLIWITSRDVDDMDEDVPAWGEERQSASEVLSLLRIDLVRMAHRSELVRVFDASYPDKVACDHRIPELRKSRKGAADPAYLTSAADPPVASVVPIRAKRPFRVPIHPAVLETSALTEVYDSLLGSMLERTRVHAQRRKEFYQAHLEKHRSRSDYYNSLSTPERKKLDDEETQVNSTIDYELGTEVTMAVPKTIRGHTWYNENLPRMIALDEQWVERMDRIVSNIERNIGEDKSGTRRLVRARVLDMVIRDVPPEDPAMQPSFQRLRRTLRPYLFHAIEGACRARGLDANLLRGRRLAFNLTIDRDAGTANIVVNAVWTSNTGVVEFAPGDDLNRVRDMSDDVHTRAAGTAPPVRGKDVIKLVDGTEEEVVRSLRAMTRADPVGAAAELLRAQLVMFSLEYGSLASPEAQELALHSDDYVLSSAGGRVASLRRFMDFIDTMKAMGRDVLPETLLRAVLRVASSFGDEPTPWLTLQAWVGGSWFAGEHADFVRESLERLKKLAPGYLESCIREERVIQSQPMIALWDRVRSDGELNLARLALNVRRSLSACVELDEFIEGGAEPPVGRESYKLLGPPLVRALLLNPSYTYIGQINSLFDHMLGGQHKTRQQMEDR